MMSTVTADEKSSDFMICCACCGIAAIDDVELKDCDGGCDLVKYCSDGCQEYHREQHEEECKNYKDLFTQPDGSHYGECPICCLPLSIDDTKSSLMSCCSKLICDGCCYANQKREHEAGLEQRCVFCREPVSKSDEESHKRRLKRIKKSDPVAMAEMGKKQYYERDYENAFKYWSKAAELGNADAHYNLSVMYREGQGVEKDMKKSVHHREEAAIAGHPMARHNLGIEEWNNSRYDRARKHFIIAAGLGDEDSLKELRELYADGHASKEDYATALRAYQAASNGTKSAEREEAEAYYKASGIIE